MCLAARLSHDLGWLDAEALVRTLALIEASGLPVHPPTGMTVDHFMHWMALDKKVAAGQLRLVLMRGIGEAILTADYPKERLLATLGRACVDANAS